MKIRSYLFFPVFIGLILNNNASAQTSYSDTLNLVTAKNNLNNLYINSLDNNLAVYKGKEYISYDKYYLKGHPFYIAGEEQEGDISYEGKLFTNIPLLYDVVLDQIVVSDPSGSLQFKLENQRISFFKVHNHVFIWLNGDTMSASPIRNGFYDLLVDGRTQVLAKRSKRIFEDATPRGMEGEFLIQDKFLVHKNNQYYFVTKKKSLLKILDSKKELQKYIRSQHLKFTKETREASLVKLVQYYNSLPTL